MIANRLADGSAQAVYVHYDGYPTRMGHALWQVLHETIFNDCETALEVLAKDHGWSQINPGEISESVKQMELREGKLLVPGVGIALGRAANTIKTKWSE